MRSALLGVLALVLLLAGIASTFLLLPRPIDSSRLPGRVIACEADGGYSVHVSGGVICVRP